MKQLTELLTEYGKIDEIWLDGTSEIGIDGKRQEYDWELILKTIHKLQPNAVTAFYGDDIRWIGNESARGRGGRMEFRCVGPGVLSGCEKA